MDESIPVDQPTAPRRLVILVHGIRTRAAWTQDVAGELRLRGFAVANASYGRFGTLQFLLPFERFRRAAVDRIVIDVRVAIQQHPGYKLSYIAHSFGSYAVARMLEREFDLRAERVIFCGSVVPADFAFENFILDRVEAKQVVNDYGTRDVWPALAEAVTWGYGAVGTYGFNRPIAHDRRHVGFKHSDYLTAAFCGKFWVPYLQGDELPAPDPVPNSLPPDARRHLDTPKWFGLLHWIKRLYLLATIALVALVVLLAGRACCVPQPVGIRDIVGGLTYFGNQIREQQLLVNSACEGPCPRWLSGLTCRRVELAEPVVPFARMVACLPEQPIDTTDVDPAVGFTRLVQLKPECLSVVDQQGNALNVRASAAAKRVDIYKMTASVPESGASPATASQEQVVTWFACGCTGPQLDKLTEQQGGTRWTTP